MASQRQIEENRRNAGTGPKTETGKAAHLDSEMNCFPRRNDPEIGPGDAAKRLGQVYSLAVREFNPLLNFTRYEARFEHSYYRALHELQRLLSQRSKPTPPPPTPTKINEKPKIGFVPQKPVGHPVDQCGPVNPRGWRAVDCAASLVPDSL